MAKTEDLPVMDITTSCLPGERWGEVPGYPGFYEVSDLGRVHSLDRVVVDRRSRRRLQGRILKQGLTSWRAPTRYWVVDLDKGNKTRVHQLVLQVFGPPRPSPYHEPCHGPGGSLDNRWFNLSWGTRTENNFDTIRDGNHVGASQTWCKRGHLLPVPKRSSKGDGYFVRQCTPCNQAVCTMNQRLRRALAGNWPTELTDPIKYEAAVQAYADAKYQRSELCRKTMEGA